MKNDGGPAFPQTVRGEFNLHNDGTSDWTPRFVPGMSLRDWFAGQSLVPLLLFIVLSEPDSPLRMGSREETATKIAHWAYMHADAMLAEREKEEK